MLNRCSLAPPWALMTNFDDLVRIPSSYRWWRMCGTSFMKDGRRKEVRKWVKSGEQVQQLPTIDRSSAMCRPVDEQFVGKTKGSKNGGKGEGKVMSDGG